MSYEIPIEVSFLNKILKDHKIEVIIYDQFLAENLNVRATLLTIGERNFNLFIGDEYEDYKYNNPVLNLCLVLRELEHYSEINDYFLWCDEIMVDPNNTEVLSYFRSLGSIYREVEKILGKINSYVTDFDFTLNANAAQYMRKFK